MNILIIVFRIIRYPFRVALGLLTLIGWFMVEPLSARSTEEIVDSLHIANDIIHQFFTL